MNARTQPMNGLMMNTWSALMSALLPVARVAARFSRRVALQIDGRTPSVEDMDRWLDLRSKASGCVVFFCSSAGEYEQAKPLMDRLARQRPDIMPFVLFFSASGVRFARARKESAPWSLAPWDTCASWNTLLDVIRPNAFVVVRYELWPAFLHEAAKRGPLFLVDATQSLTATRHALARRMRARLMQHFSKVFVVGENDATFAQTVLGVPADKVVITGDTKYDRVRERALARRDDIARMKSRLDTVLGHDRRLIIGSAWPADATAALDAFVASRSQLSGWRMILAPHDISPGMIATMDSLCSDRGLSVNHLSSWVSLETPPALSPLPDVLIADTMGMLSELYGAAHAAFVGGALHYRVHNVLEPACHGLPVAFGPLFQSSPEATHFVNRRLASVVSDAATFGFWWKSLPAPDVSRVQNSAMLDEVNMLCGAADKIMPTVMETLPMLYHDRRPR